MPCILVATDLGNGSHNALGRACRIARETRSELYILHVAKQRVSGEGASAIRRRLHDEAETVGDAPPLLEMDLSVLVAEGEPAHVILGKAARLNPDLIVLGARQEPRFRDAILGTTAAHVSRDARQPVLVVRNDYHRRYERVMAAVEEACVEQVLHLACSVAPIRDLYVVHAFASASHSHFGYGDVLEDVLADQMGSIEQAIARFPALQDTPPRVHNIVEEGDVMSVLMREWDKTKPDLLVVGTHGRHGLPGLLHERVSETVLLCCPSDILVAPRQRAAGSA